MKIEKRLFELCRKNADSSYINERLYRLLYSETLYEMAYHNIKSNTGIMTAGVSAYSMDGVSISRIQTIIQNLKDESYQPKPCKRVLIPKVNGKFRPLGLPDANDKLVQEAVRIILECIYDSPNGATFSKQSFGFRRDLGCHNALQSVHDQFRNCIWLIKADIKGFFDNVNHEILIGLLRKRIKDEKFIRLIWKFLRAGIVDKGQFQKTLKGTPQGGIISPILANIYLHEFDKYVEQLRQEKGTVMVSNKEYFRYSSQKHYYKTKLKKYPPEDARRVAIKQKIKELQEQQSSLPSWVVKDSSKGQIKYVRYADDWMIAIKGTKAYAQQINDLCQKFYKEKLQLSWNLEKSKFIRTIDEDTEFLGTMLHFRSLQSTKYRYVIVGGTRCKKRTVSVNNLVLNVPKKMVLERLKGKGFFKREQGEYKPTHMTKLLPLSDYQIVLRYNAVMRGIANYYSFCNNPQELAHIKYLLTQSLVRTLGNKHKICGTKVWKRYGKKLTARRSDRKKTVSFDPVKDFKRRPLNFKTKFIKRDTATEFLLWGLRSNNLLRNYGCSICGTTNEKIEVHHVRHIKKTNVRYEGFYKVMGYINRKQIPVCHRCHQDIHNGKYDGVPLKELAEQVAIRMGIKQRPK